MVRFFVRFGKVSDRGFQHELIEFWNAAIRHIEKCFRWQWVGVKIISGEVPKCISCAHKVVLNIMIWAETQSTDLSDGRFISQTETSTSALRAVAQAAANTDGLLAGKQSDTICWEIAQAPGLLTAVVSKMANDVDAVRLVNNLAANSEQSALLIANTPGSIEALKVYFILHILSGSLPLPLFLLFDRLQLNVSSCMRSGW
jgi:hypothetical protein